MDIIAIPLGKILSICYSVSGDYLLSILLLTLITKIILFPFSIFVQKDSIKMVRILPEITNLKCDYYGDNERINEETLKLYKREHYHPFLSILPLVLQLLMLMGVIEVVKNTSYSGIIESQMLSVGMDFSIVPSTRMGIYLLFPILAAATSFIMCVVQNKRQVLQAEQGLWNKYGMLVFSTLLSLYLGFFVKSGVAAYWIASNVLGILQVYLMNLIINPEKFVDHKKLDESRARLASLNQTKTKLTPDERKRQRNDYKRFFSVDNKHLVFYSESSGFYKYFHRLIEWLTSHSSIKIHYITSDPNDQIFEIAKKNSQIIPYFISENKLISLFLKMDAKMVIMTVPDLDNYHLKRSYVNKNTEYIYMDHGMTSMNALTRKGSLDHFDTLFCAGPHNCDEARSSESVYHLPKRTLVKYGYGMLEDLAESYAANSANSEFQEDFILLAPSHQPDNILDSCLDTVVDGLKKSAKVIIRPHPQYIRRYPQKWKIIEQKYQSDPQVVTQSDFSSNDTIYKAALVVTDWSNIAYEFSFATLKPALFVNTTPKILNPDYKEIGIEPVDFTLRSKIGIEVSGKDLDEITTAVRKLLCENYMTAEHIADVRSSTVFNFMSSSEVGGRYILNRLKNKEVIS